MTDYSWMNEPLVEHVGGVEVWAQVVPIHPTYGGTTQPDPVGSWYFMAASGVPREFWKLTAPTDTEADVRKALLQWAAKLNTGFRK